jgi:amino acid transporter
VFGRKTHEGHDDTVVHDRDTGPVYTEAPKERYGGFTFSAAFFGWLVAVALTVLLAGIVGVGATAAGTTLNVTQNQAEEQVRTLGLAGAIALLVILLIAYFAGGYVAGRMSRFDGGRQGLGVWMLGLLVTILVAVLGAVFGTQYDIFQQVNLPSAPIPTNTLTVGGVVALVAVLLGTLMAAMVGGKAGQRYHTKIDRAVVA